MNEQELRAMLERRNPKAKIKAIRIYKKSFKIVAETDAYRLVRWCYYPIENVRDIPDWWSHLRL